MPAHTWMGGLQAAGTPGCTLAPIEPDRKCNEPPENCDYGPFTKNLAMDLARANPPGQYLIKACFKFDFKLW